MENVARLASGSANGSQADGGFQTAEARLQITLSARGLSAVKSESQTQGKLGTRARVNQGQRFQNTPNVSYSSADSIRTQKLVSNKVVYLKEAFVSK